ncbi:hypothetical protein LEP1GSC115_0093 [Leptospira interrogans serovar Australis str. 200703203]|uniref:Uncharacterized protein n=1 Tax=Leptospira interrogans serovar Australis str. 200703203 TaxID=1085541 RepID=N1UMW6_LEPIR|nr:hypothetical protein LEP1GSC115_0093 [Leptospira interrogans serovar Australis str. 200703203]
MIVLGKLKWYVFFFEDRCLKGLQKKPLSSPKTLGSIKTGPSI